MRATLFIITLVSAVLLPFPFFVVLCVIYSALYTPWELFCIAILIDAQYGEVRATEVWYAYTLTVAVLLVCSELLKPYLKFYNVST